MHDFKDYIDILKILRNMRTRNENFLRLVWTALWSFVKKPSLFDNYNELYEVDKLHSRLLTHGDEFISSFYSRKIE